MVSNCGITKMLRAIVHDGYPSQLASKMLRGANINVNNYLCEYSTNFKYCGIIGSLLKIPITMSG